MMMMMMIKNQSYHNYLHHYSQQQQQKQQQQHLMLDQNHPSVSSPVLFNNNNNNINNNNLNNSNMALGKDDLQNQFQSSISCGHLEFYVQLTFNKPFKGLVYAYKMYQTDQSDYYYYPLEILDSCTIRGNGASIVYLELSFLSECVEKLPLIYSQSFSESLLNPSISNQTNPIGDTINDHSDATSSSSFQSNQLYNQVHHHHHTSSPTQTFNLDGFNFRRALNENPSNHQQLNISKDETFQLSLYIQNDPKIEQKFDSKVVVQCSSQITKNIIMEQNSGNDFYRKMDQQNSIIASLQPQQRTIQPRTNLTISRLVENESDPLQIDANVLIESRMDILRGRIPFLKLIDGNVELGDDVTLIIRSGKLNDYDSKISNCYAFDEKDSMRYQLTDQNGCPIDPMVMTPFKVLHNVGSESKVYYTTFSAFKFPGSQFLNIQCTLLVCPKLCPKPTCESPSIASQSSTLMMMASTLAPLNQNHFQHQNHQLQQPQDHHHHHHLNQHQKKQYSIHS
ncbi:hypothetical protein SSS_03626 [Sarcoptes scabiei]|nr:hypothetical protein SSS_03626 [Sarcoptes scabiei]